MSISLKDTSRIYQNYTTVAHRLNKVGCKSLWISILLLYNGIFQLLHVYGWVWSGINPSLHPKDVPIGDMSGNIEAKFKSLILLSEINCCVILAVCGLALSCCRIAFPLGKLSYMNPFPIWKEPQYLPTLNSHTHWHSRCGWRQQDASCCVV